MAVAADGYAHARFVGEFFAGPIDSYSAVSSDNGVATAGVNPPDMLIVAPVSNGTASITVTAFGPGGMATQTFVARVGAGATQVNRPTVPQPSPPPAAPAPPPAREEPAADESAVMVPTDELPPRPPDSAAGDSTTDAVPTESLPPVQATAAPTLSGNVPAQTIGVGQTVTVDVTPYFGGVVQGWAVASSSSSSVEALMTVVGRVTLRGLTIGNSMITVTAANNLGEVAQAFQVTVGASSGTTTTTAAGTTTTTTAATTTTTRAGSGGILTLVGTNPRASVSVGQSTTLDLSQYFSTAATRFAVIYDAADPNRLVDVTLAGSVATISGLRAGTVTVELEASTTNTRIRRPATITVN